MLPNERGAPTNVPVVQCSLESPIQITHEVLTMAWVRKGSDVSRLQMYHTIVIFGASVEGQMLDVW